MTPINKDFLISLGFKEQIGPIIITYEISISAFLQNYKTISCTIQYGNQYVYLREGKLHENRIDDDIITVYNSDIQGPLTCEWIENLLILLKPNK